MRKSSSGYWPKRSLVPMLCLAAAATVSCAPASGSPGKQNLKRADRAEWHAALQWPVSCEEAFDYPDPDFSGLRFFELAPKQFLVEVVCTRGAYQGYQIYLHLDERKSRPVAALLTFPTYEAADENEQSLSRSRTTEVWGTTEFDPAKKQLIVLNRSRAIGDCGSRAIYSFESGRARLREFRAKTRCDGAGAEHPELWPKITVQAP